MTVLEELTRVVAACRTPRVRTMREFAEQEIILPDGPYEGRRFSCQRQPYTRLWFAELDSGRWSESVATGPSQSGKTLSCFVIPTLYHLFEIRETVIVGLPTLEMAQDKWREDFLPVIERSRFSELLPKRGAGSRGGRLDPSDPTACFENGATLKFMSGGGNDKKRSGFTSRVVCITEADGMDEAGEASREANKISQLHARTRAYRSSRRIYAECTASIATGYIWRTFNAGSQAAIICPCPHCAAWVSPEREHFVGWKGLASEGEARAGGHFICPSCQQPLSDEARVEMNHRAQLLHRGQRVTAAGQIEGAVPETDVFGFRWSAFNNLFTLQADLAVDEWRGSQRADEDDSEKELKQFIWAVPYDPPVVDAVNLTAAEIARRISLSGRGELAEGETLVAAIDLGKYQCHWTALAWSDGATGRVVDYGVLQAPAAQLGVEAALSVTLREFATQILERSTPKVVLIDAGYMPEVVYAFCRQMALDLEFCPFVPALGRGAGQQHAVHYHKPKATGATVKLIEEHYHVAWFAEQHLHVVEFDTDAWKTWTHERLATPLGRPGALALFRGDFSEHFTYAKHLTAEKRVVEFVAGKGHVTKWIVQQRQNHWLDATCMASVAGHLAGVRIGEAERKLVPARRRSAVLSAPVVRPDGRRF